MKLVRPAIWIGGLVAILGALMLRGHIATANPPLYGGIALGVGIAFLLFAILAVMAWRVLKSAADTQDSGPKT
ncbi:hypothetical protein [Hyphobacterium marinum]|uniref:Uncharacterized protein n=1 Tax=Hyphobacterium marinum TaxID=3116574 RepID=A0ABU7LZ31_9PROT|nr:hypothetical protein [Hyphobacterium sp. Y6023]MEE2566799.1 hypothetical protein [Hyphobacterium sp. Y6023]